MSEIDNSIVELRNFSQELKIDDYIPHKSLFLDGFDYKEKETNSFLFSTLYLLTNNKFLIEHFLNFNPDQDKNEDLAFLKMIENLVQYIKELKDDNNKNNFDKLSDSIKQFRKFLGNEKLDPRYLMRHILVKALKTQKKNSLSNEILPNGNNNNIIISEGESSFLENILLNLDSFNFISTSSISSSFQKNFENSFSLLNDSQQGEIEKDIKDIIIKVQAVDGKNNYICTNFIIFNLSEESKNKYKIVDCFKNYLDQIKHTEIKSKIFYKLPETIIILLSFGKDKEKPENCLYNFSENLDFSKDEYAGCLDEKLRSKKYILSGLIACKYPKQYKEFFYTFCRKTKSDNDKKYYIYNSKELRVHDIENVDNKLKKLETKDQENTSYPYVLVYNEIKN